MAPEPKERAGEEVRQGRFDVLCQREMDGIEAARAEEHGAQQESVGRSRAKRFQRWLLGDDWDQLPTPAYEVPEWRREPPEKDLFGLALSGGGIRSAAFNLGLLQGLHRLKLLGGFDYLSTVSGGGYVGGFWSAWKSRQERACRGDEHKTGEDGQGPSDGRGPEPVFPGDERETGEEGEQGPSQGQGPEPRAVRHLREFSNFLQPRTLLLSFETGRLVAGVVAAVVPALLVSFSLLLLALFAWLGLAWLLASPQAAVALRGERLVPAAAAFALVAFVQLGFEWVWSFRPQEPGAGRLPTFIATTLTASAAAGGAWWLASAFVPRPFSDLLRPLAAEDAGGPLAAVLSPVAAFAAAALLLVGVRTVLSRSANLGARQRNRMKTMPRHEWRLRLNAFDRTISRLVFLVCLWAVAGVVWIAGQVLAGGGLGSALAAAGTGGASGALFAWLRRLLLSQPHKPAGGRWMALIQPRLLKLLAFVALAAFTTAAAAGVVLAWAAGGWDGSLLLLAAAGAVVVLALIFFDPHEVGFHSFYRARLVRAFLGATHGEPSPPRHTTTDCAGDDLPLDQLPSRPLHLICCAANDLSGDPMPTLNRGAESAVLSRHGIQVGNRWRSWRPPGPLPSLGDAMTASAAAVNSHMGQHSMTYGPAATFLFAALNLRLGLWLENPAGDDGWFGRFGASLQRVLRGSLYFRELLGGSRADSSWVHLSDGGHFENLALYELVRRHCRFILLSDCGADPDRAFDDFGNAVRRVREDFGVQIQIDVAPLRSGKDRLSQQPVVAGDIVYGDNDVGVLLYVKPALTGCEPADIANYSRRNEHFPHETTLDQFYDAAQWESYRRLGQFVAESALAGLPALREKKLRDEVKTT